MNICSGTTVTEVHSGQVRMAYRLAEHYADQLLYVYGIGWLSWDGTRWSDRDPGAPKRAVVEILRAALAESLGDKQLQADVRKCESASGVAGVLDLAAALEPFATTVADLDADPYLLNVANGTLDLRTIELQPHDPADRITKVTRAAWDCAAPTTTWGTFLAQVLPVAEVREFLQRLAEATMKRLTGGDTIRARRMRQDFIEFTPSHTAIMITNHLPKVSGDDPAIWRRLRVVPFAVVIPEAERNKHLDEALQLDANAVLAWAVAGYLDYAARGELSEPKSVLTATSDYQKASDAVARFLDEETTRCNGFAITAELFARWCRWAQIDGTEALSQRAFGQALDGHGLPGDKGAKGIRIRRGVILNSEDGGDS